MKVKRDLTRKDIVMGSSSVETCFLHDSKKLFLVDFAITVAIGLFDHFLKENVIRINKRPFMNDVTLLVGRGNHVSLEAWFNLKAFITTIYFKVTRECTTTRFRENVTKMKAYF